MPSTKTAISKASKGTGKENASVKQDMNFRSTSSKPILQQKSQNSGESTRSADSRISTDFLHSITNVPRSSGVRKNFPIFNDPSRKQIKVKNVATQTPSHDAAELMCSEEPTEKYWELLAEQRRKALKEALEENEKLAETLEAKNEEIADLKAEIEVLEETSSHAHYLASVIKKIGKDVLEIGAENLESVAEDSSCSDDDDVPEENRLSEYSAPDSDPDPDTNGTPKKKKGGDVAVSSPTTSSVPSAVVSNKNMSFEEKRSPVADADQSSVKKETCT